MLASQKNDVNMASLLISFGADLDAFSDPAAAHESKVTALGLACRSNQTKMIELLVSQGASPHMVKHTHILTSG